MDNLNLEFFLNNEIQINLDTFLLSLVCSAILSFFVQLFYINFSSTLSNRVHFSKNFVVLGVTTCIIIMIVKNSLALSLGLVGALSIVRFRAAIKEPEELVYLFLINWISHFFYFPIKFHIKIYQFETYLSLI